MARRGEYISCYLAQSTIVFCELFLEYLFDALVNLNKYTSNAYARTLYIYPESPWRFSISGGNN